jgi:hypothetical protein
MDEFRMVIGDQLGAKEISRGSKEELIDSLNSQKDLVRLFVRISNRSGDEVANKQIGESTIVWNF